MQQWKSGHSKDVEILDTGTGYIEAMVGGKHIMFGRAAALAGLGIDIPEDVTAEDEDLLGDCSALYMIYQHKLVAKMIVHYLIDPDFEYILRQLTASGMCVCVKTFDPSIDEDMIYRQIRSGKYSLRVIKYRNTEEITKYSDRADGGIVSRDGTKALLQTISSCDKILSARKNRVCHQRACCSTECCCYGNRVGFRNVFRFAQCISGRGSAVLADSGCDNHKSDCAINIY